MQNVQVVELEIIQNTKQWVPWQKATQVGNVEQEGGGSIYKHCLKSNNVVKSSHHVGWKYP